MPADSHRRDDYRFERKFVVTAAPRQEIAAAVRLHSIGFIEAYPDRYVNSIYLDCPGLSAYTSSVDGNSHRLKVRVRWYGEAFDGVRDPTLELKLKRNSMGRKQRYPLPRFDLGPGFGDAKLKSVLSQAALPPEVGQLLVGLQLRLLVRYRRSYYKARREPIRVTLDDELQFWALEPHRNLFLRRARDRRTTVVEAKYGPPMEEKARQLNQEWRFRVTKQSKYVTGLAMVQLRAPST